MSDLITIVMAGSPVAKGRPRFSPKTGIVYTPAKTARYEDRLAWAAQAAMVGRPLFDGPLTVGVRVFIGIPVSKPKRWIERARGGLEHPTKKPDADNYAKILDALNKVVWIDDSQIVELLVCKVYSDQPRIEIGVSRKLACG